MPRIATILLLLALVGGTSAAFAVTQRLKDEPSPIGTPRFTPRVIAPTCECDGEATRMRLRLREGDSVTAVIVDADGEPVRTLLDGKRARRGPLVLEWDGRAQNGSVVPDGRYRLEVRLERQDRTILLPTTIEVDTVAPRARILDVRASPNRVRVVYRTNDRAGADLSVRGTDLPETVVVRGRSRPAGRAGLNWSGRVDGRPLPPGEYTLVLRARDPAGNVSEPVTATVELTGQSG